MQRIRWAISQIAVPRSEKLPEPLPMLIDVGDLLSGWALLDQRRWRTGQTPAPWSQRARELGGVTAWRSFQAAAEMRWLWVEAIPLADDTDAEGALSEVWTRAVKNQRAQVQLVGESDGPNLGLGTATRTLEQATEGPAGRGTVRMVAWAHRGVVNVLSASANGEPMTWNELEALASEQNRRIDRVLDSPLGR